MFNFGLMKRPRHKQYSYTPKYYDERKEEIREALEQVEKRKAKDTEGMKARIAHQFGKGGGSVNDRSYRRKRVRRSNYMLLIVIIFLIFLAYVLLDVYLPGLFDAMRQ